jgi:hypothetical protein
MSKRATTLADITAGEQPSSSGRTPWGDIPRYRIKIGQLENALAAVAHADQLGLRPNWTLDIHYERGQLAQPYLSWSASLQGFLKLIRDWARSYEACTAYIWTTENVRGSGTIGVHTHLLIHIPLELDNQFKKLVPQWGRRAGMVMKSAKEAREVLHAHRIGEGNPTMKAVCGKLRYMSKDLEQPSLDLLFPFKRLNGEPQIHGFGSSTGGVLGKKLGVSRNIDRAARKAFRHDPTQPTRWLSADGRERQIFDDVGVTRLAA